MLKRFRDFMALTMGISTPGAEPNEVKWERLRREREEAEKRKAEGERREAKGESGTDKGNDR